MTSSPLNSVDGAGLQWITFPDGDHLISVSRACSDFTVEVPVGSTLEALFVNNTQRVPRPQSSRTPFFRCLLLKGDRESGSGHASREPGSVKL